MDIYAWLEIDGTPDIEEIAIKGGKLWGQLVDGLILSVDRGVKHAVELFGRIVSHLGGVCVIPGNKTSPILGREGFDSLELWADLVDFAAQLSPTDGPLVLEHESALRHYLRESDPLVMDYGRLEQCVRQFKGRELWWYPGMAGDAADRLVYGRIARAADAPHTPNNCRLIDLSISRNIEHTYDSEGAIRLRRELGAATMSPVIPMIYTIDGYWKANELQWARQFAERVWPAVTTMIVYPGTGDWITSAEQVQRLQSKEWFEGPA